MYGYKSTTKSPLLFSAENKKRRGPKSEKHLTSFLSLISAAASNITSLKSKTVYTSIFFSAESATTRPAAGGIRCGGEAEGPDVTDLEARGLDKAGYSSFFSSTAESAAAGPAAEAADAATRLELKVDLLGIVTGIHREGRQNFSRSKNGRA